MCTFGRSGGDVHWIGWTHSISYSGDWKYCHPDSTVSPPLICTYCWVNTTARWSCSAVLNSKLGDLKGDKKITYSNKIHTVGSRQVRAKLVVFIQHCRVCNFMPYFLFWAFRQACEVGITAIWWMRKLRARIPQLLRGQVEPDLFGYQLQGTLGFPAATLKGSLILIFPASTFTTNP